MHFIAQVTNQQGTVTNRGFVAFADAVQFARFEAKSGRRTVRVLHAPAECECQLCQHPDDVCKCGNITANCCCDAPLADIAFDLDFNLEL